MSRRPESGRTAARVSRMALLAPALFALTLASFGCDAINDDEPYDPSCSSSSATQMVGGVWTLTGEGSRGDCANPLHDARRFTLALNSLSVRQDGARLSLQAPAPFVPGGSFALDGEVRGDCVSFSVVERSGSGVVERNFVGWARYSGEVSGTFTGSGPAGCDVEGTFNLTVSGQLGSGPGGAPLPEDIQQPGEDILQPEEDIEVPDEDAGKAQDDASTADAGRDVHLWGPSTEKDVVHQRAEPDTYQSPDTGIDTYEKPGDPALPIGCAAGGAGTLGGFLWLLFAGAGLLVWRRL